VTGPKEGNVIGSDLIMALTLEQGPGRETQVQPPLGVWVVYFAIDLDNPPVLALTEQRPGAHTEHRQIVEHDHNWTVEIPAVGPGRPAVIRFRRTGHNQYSYWICREGDVEFDHCTWLLETFPNPHWVRGRRWLVI
jgi:hypothetical protein